MNRYIYYKELAHTVMETDNPKSVSWQAGDPGEFMRPTHIKEENMLHSVFLQILISLRDIFTNTPKIIFNLSNIWVPCGQVTLTYKINHHTI